MERPRSEHAAPSAGRVPAPGTRVAARPSTPEPIGSGGRGVIRRRMASTAALLAAGLLTLGACTDGDDDGGDANDEVTTTTAGDADQTTTSDDEVTTTTADGEPTTTTTGGDGDGDEPTTTTGDGDDGSDDGSEEGLPTSAEEWATATFEAWQEESDADLMELMTDEARDEIEARAHSEENGWSEEPQCEGAAGSVFCQFVQEGGDEALILQISNQAVAAGEPAVTGARFGPPEPLPES